MRLDDHFEGRDIIAYQKDLREKRCANPATARRELVTLKCYFNRYEEIYLREQTPFEGLRLDLKIPKKLPRLFDRSTLSTLFRSADYIIKLDPLDKAQDLYNLFSCSDHGTHRKASCGHRTEDQ